MQIRFHRVGKWRNKGGNASTIPEEDQPALDNVAGNVVLMGAEAVVAQLVTRTVAVIPEGAPVNMTERKDNDVTILAMAGRLDTASAPEADKRLNAMIDAGVRLLVLDCGELEYVGSAGLRTILAATKRIRAAQGTLVLARPEAQVKEVLEFAGFTGFLPTTATIDAAIRGCRA